MKKHEIVSQSINEIESLNDIFEFEDLESLESLKGGAVCPNLRNFCFIKIERRKKLTSSNEDSYSLLNSNEFTSP